MPPKKVKPEAAPEPKPKPKAIEAKPVKPTARKAKEPAVFTLMPKDAGALTLVDVQYEGLSLEAKPTQRGGYRHVLKLEAASAFTMVQTYTIAEGEFVGHQAIIIRPAKPFDFLKLPKELRARIYGFYFAAKGVVGAPIVLDGKRTDTKEVYAKHYAEGSKSRVGLLAVNKEAGINSAPSCLFIMEPSTIFYAHTLRLESTSALLEFLMQAPSEIKPLLKSIEVKTFSKSSARNAFFSLAADAKNITKLRFEQGVYAGTDPAAAVKSFYADTYKFLTSIGQVKGAKDAGVDILEFGKQAFTDKVKEGKAWSKEDREQFIAKLREKLR
ncbi:hypothetical protein BAUCODRAFT_149354 [Baudoinia panamericana UAMH 10762]|uniref:Uncharacterized protein n=1 Tax=Baudoinia panamericana (strain UAMH 10762) TaxID=717646 RepID=M2LM18_BAUPA|nr:uncharacterized protein BAUCODRAFT_149354 [Baudoinia panamericana UAMH 10762]EMC95367.1 hypothetical protein BAUCODRAFT_149354 [Baudoinia panamericana UAMH 10762]